MGLSKRVIAATLVSATMSTAVSTTAVADTITMNVGFGAPQESIYGRLGSIFEQLTEAYTEGTVDVRLRCCNQIATEDEAFRAIQLGTVDSYFISGNNISSQWPLIDVTVLPYIFQNTAHLERVVDGEVGDFMRERVLEDTRVHLLTFGPALYRDLYNSVRPVNTMADMEGLRIRTPNNAVMIATFEAFGANPVPLAWSETPTALQTGTVDGGDNGTSFIRDMSFHEFMPHLVILEHFVAVAPLFASDTFMQRLSEEQREQIMRAAVDAGVQFREEFRTETEQVRQWLVEEGGMARTDPERSAFIAAAQEVQQAVAAERGQEFVDLVNMINAAAE